MSIDNGEIGNFDFRRKITDTDNDINWLAKRKGTRANWSTEGQ